MIRRMARKVLRRYRYIKASISLKAHPVIEPVFFEDAEVVRLIIDESKSLARFGEGEFRWMEMDDSIESFQVCDEKLSQALVQAFYYSGNEVLIAVPRVYFDREDKTFSAKLFNVSFLVQHRAELNELFSSRDRFANAAITRPYIDYKNKKNAKARFDLVRHIWEGRSVLIAEGEGTRFGVGNDLLDNSLSVSRLLCPSENAFFAHDAILKIIKELAVPRETLVLLCLGPTATVLAVELASAGIQAVDIGHFDIEYEWYLSKARNKQPIHNKYTNEAGGTTYSNCYDDQYLASIVGRVLVDNQTDVFIAK